MEPLHVRVQFALSELVTVATVEKSVNGLPRRSHNPPKKETNVQKQKVIVGASEGWTPQPSNWLGILYRGGERLTQRCKGRIVAAHAARKDAARKLRVAEPSIDEEE